MQMGMEEQQGLGLFGGDGYLQQGIGVFDGEG
jgi:hypothetical protein